jgi:UDP-glucose-4-epimerase GalE
MAKVLVVGGAGYVGGATVAHLLDQGHDPWVLDDLSTGFRELVLTRGFTHARVGDTEAVKKLLATEKFDCVMHFAARSLVGESVRKPEEYFENNVVQTQRMLETLIESGHPGHRKLIFSSTCAIYGDPQTPQIDESCPKKPINPYGESKLAAEKLLERFAADQGLQAIALRYFNASGADPKLRTGEWHHPETHLIPRVLKAVLENSTVEVFGTDYETEDGTCVRDYVHVMDLARAHEAAMLRLLKLPAGAPGKFEAYNLGSENGFSVREIIEGVMLITGKTVRVVDRPRRPGDPSILVADSQMAQKILGFKIQYSLEEIIGNAYSWEQKKSRMKRKAVFLDRDGTINEDPGYLSDPDQVKILPEVAEALSALKRAGYLLLVVSNQSGIGRGLIQPETLPKIHDRVNFLLRPTASTINEFFYCTHIPDDHCACRKPEPKLLLDASREFDVDLSKSYMVGDKISDIEVGPRAGVRASLLVRSGEGKTTEAAMKSNQASFTGNSLLEVANWILAQET